MMCHPIPYPVKRERLILRYFLNPQHVAHCAELFAGEGFDPLREGGKLLVGGHEPRLPQRVASELTKFRHHQISGFVVHGISLSFVFRPDRTIISDTPR